jgi:hypothetical protein
MAVIVTFVPPELRMNEEFTKETTVVRTHVENKHESRNRKALSWIRRKRWREVASRKRSAITSAVSSYKLIIGDGRYLKFFYLQISFAMAICWLGWQRVCCGSQTQNVWPIKIAGSTMNMITTAKKGRFRCMGLIRMMVRRIERRASLMKWIQNEYYCHTESMNTHQTVV